MAKAASRLYTYGIMPTERAIERAHSYAFSRRKAFLLDGLFVFGTAPWATRARQRARRYATEHNLPVVFRQERVGQDGMSFLIEKFTTLYQDEHGEDVVINDVASWMRRTRRDELAQRANLWPGIGRLHAKNMSVVGRRPTISVEYAQFRDELDTRTRALHDRIVEPTLPGIASTFAIEWATGREVGSQQHAEQNIEDVMNGSVHYDAMLLLRLGRALLASRLHDRRFEDAAPLASIADSVPASTVDVTAPIIDQAAS